jgi:hypothetical protein
MHTRWHAGSWLLNGSAGDGGGKACNGDGLVHGDKTRASEEMGSKNLEMRNSMFNTLQSILHHLVLGIGQRVLSDLHDVLVAPNMEEYGVDIVAIQWLSLTVQDLTSQPWGWSNWTFAAKGCKMRGMFTTSNVFSGSIPRRTILMARWERYSRIVQRISGAVRT